MASLPKGKSPYFSHGVPGSRSNDACAAWTFATLVSSGDIGESVGNIGSSRSFESPKVRLHTPERVNGRSREDPWRLLATGPPLSLPSPVISLSALYMMLCWGKFLQHRSTSAPLFGCIYPKHMSAADTKQDPEDATWICWIYQWLSHEFVRLLTHVNFVFFFCCR